MFATPNKSRSDWSLAEIFIAGLQRSMLRFGGPTRVPFFQLDSSSLLFPQDLLCVQSRIILSKKSHELNIEMV